MQDIKSFKMISGEEVVAELAGTSLNGSEYTLRRPHVLQFQQIASGKFALAFIPWSLSNPTIEEIIVPKSALLIPPFNPDPNVERQYIEQTSGLTLAQPNQMSKFVKA